jgi:hypothetical protein
MRLAEKCAGRRDGGPDGFQSAGDGGLCQGLRGAFTTEDAEDTEECERQTCGMNCWA